MDTNVFFAQHSPNTSNVTPQRLMATLLMVKKDRNCLLEWGILSTKSVQSTDDFAEADVAS